MLSLGLLKLIKQNKAKMEERINDSEENMNKVSTAPKKAPVEEAPVEEAPVEAAPVEEAAVEAPVEEAPVEEAPVEEAPVEVTEETVVTEEENNNKKSSKRNRGRPAKKNDAEVKSVDVSLPELD